MTSRNMMLALSLVLALVAQAAAQPTTAGIQLGGTIYGPPMNADKLKDHVVLLEFWGIN